MKVLLIHPDDDPCRGAWIRQRWNRAIDLGFAGPETYRMWSESLGCKVRPLDAIELEDLKTIRESLFAGLGRMSDRHGLDWWELISLRFHESLERLLSLQKWAAAVDSCTGISSTRCSFDSRAIELLLRRQVHCFAQTSHRAGLRRSLRALSKFRLGEIVQILGDKYDADYKVRRLVARAPRKSARPVVLLPSAYVNASRTALAYASGLSDRDFLLVTTRESGRISSRAGNVANAKLSSYAQGRLDEVEYQDVLERWRKLEQDLGENWEFSILRQLGAFTSVPALLREGLAIRDAWLRVFDCENVSSVLCTDDTNPYTRIPLLLAKNRGIPAISSHHGALDGRYLFKRTHADRILAKGRMESDYLTKICGVDREKLAIAAPSRKIATNPLPHFPRDLVVFFSEPYEIAGGRTVCYYREVLPRLADLAAEYRRELVIKLHPHESPQERRQMVNTILSIEQRKTTRLVDGPLHDDLLARTWCAATVHSTVAVDCTLRGIPVFLCTWLDHSNYGYVEQFLKFGAGMNLDSANEIAEIPRRLEVFSPKETSCLWEPATSERLQELFLQPAAPEPESISA